MSHVARFEIDYLQYLGADGRPVREFPVALRDPAALLPLFKQMLYVRAFDTKAIALQRTGKLGTYAPCPGHEATHVGIGAAMAEGDVYAPSYREYGVLFMRGVRPREVLLYWGGDERGNDFQEGGARHDFPFCVPISTQCLHAAGAALAFKLRGEPHMAVATCGDGGTSKTDFYAALNSAGAYDLPLVLAVVNNGWAISVPRSAQTGAQTLAQKGIAGGLFCLQVDGNDLVAVLEAMRIASERARSGQNWQRDRVHDLSPVRPHHRRRRAPLPRRRRGQGRVGARADDAAAHCWLTAQGAWSEAEEAAWKLECERLVNIEVDAYLATPVQPVEAMFDYLYADPPPELLAQRANAIALTARDGRSTAMDDPVLDHGRTPSRDLQPPSGLTAGDTASHDATRGGQPMTAIPTASPVTQPITLIEAITQALAWELEHDPSVLVLGEDVGVNGGVFRATAGLQQKFGAQRVLDTPLDETTIAGLSVGLTAQGMKPVAEAQFDGFVYPMLDHLICHAARLRNRTRGRLHCPMVLRVPWGGGIRAPEHHSEANEAVFTNVPGLRVVMPSSPQRAYGLLLAAIREQDPVIYMEPKRLYRQYKEVVANDGEALPLDVCFVLRDGTDVTLVGPGAQ